MIKIGRKARYGGPSSENVISAWPFSSSSSTTTYETQLHEDGVLTCNCPGWVRATKKLNYSIRAKLPFKCDLADGSTFRSCKHVQEKVFEAQQILDGTRKPIFKRMDGTHSTPSVVIKEVPKIVERIVEKVVIKEVQMQSPSTIIRTGKRLLRAEAKED